MSNATESIPTKVSTSATSTATTPNTKKTPPTKETDLGSKPETKSGTRSEGRFSR